MFASLATTAAALSSSAKSCISDSSAFLLNSRPPIWRRVKRSLTKNKISSLDEVASGRERSSRASRRIRSLPRLKEEAASPQRLQSVSVRRRVDKISGRRLTRSEFSDQWGDSEISERRDLTAASFKRMTYHLEAKQQQQQQPQQNQSLASHFHLLHLVENLAEVAENGTRDQQTDALIAELSTQFEKCQQLLNSIGGTIKAKSTTVGEQKRRLEESENLLAKRRDLISNYRSSVEEIINSQI